MLTETVIGEFLLRFGDSFDDEPSDEPNDAPTVSECMRVVK